MNTRTKNKSEALKYANRVRVALGKSPIRKLPKGIPLSPCNCPVALAIEDSQVQVKTEGLCFYDNPIKNYLVGTALGYEGMSMDETNNFNLLLPKGVERFVKDFDDNKYPDLVDINELVRGYRG